MTTTYRFSKRTVAEEAVAGRTVLVREGYDLPMEDGKISNDFRIRASLPTLRYLLQHDAKRIVLIAHMGRPDGKVVPELSLRSAAERLGELLGEPIDFESGEGRIVMYENLRFSPLEEENSLEFAQELVDRSGAELFVQDAFSNLHRAHASMDAITKLLPSVAGFLVEKEVTDTKRAIVDPRRPLLAVIGGAKEDKVPLIELMQRVADRVALGGLIGQDYRGADPDGKLLLPVDARTDESGVQFDIGDRSALAIVQAIDLAETVIWNGTVGKAEEPEFARSSELVATALGSGEKTTIICGGDTTGFVLDYQKTHPELQYTLVSTGGGASLDLILGQPLPGLASLLDK